MGTHLPKDDFNHRIPALRFKSDKAHAIAADNVASARNSVAFSEGVRVVSLYATGDCYIQFGDSNVEATTGSHFFPAGIYYDCSLGGVPEDVCTHVAVLGTDANEITLYVSEKE